MLLSPLAETISNLVQVIRDTLNAPANRDCGPMAGDTRITIQPDAVSRFQNEFKLAELLKRRCPTAEDAKKGAAEDRLTRALQVAHEIVSNEGSEELRGLLYQLLQHQMYRVNLWDYDRKHYAVFVPVSERLLTRLEAAAGLPAAAPGSNAGGGEAATSPAAGEQNPYAQLADILRNLYWLAAEARRNQTDVFDQINTTTDPWDAAEQLIRSASPRRGIPLAIFDPVLNQARQIRDELVQVAAGNKDVAFHIFDRLSPEAERRLKGLGMTWVGSDTGAPVATPLPDVTAVALPAVERGPEAPPAWLATLSGTRMRALLEALWNKGNVPIEAVLQAVYGTKSPKNDEALRKLVIRTNQKLSREQRQLEIARQGTTLILRPV